MSIHKIKVRCKLFLNRRKKASVTAGILKIEIIYLIPITKLTNTTQHRMSIAIVRAIISPIVYVCLLVLNNTTDKKLFIMRIPLKFNY